MDAEQLIRETGIVAILRGFDRDASRSITDAVTRGGVRAVEITANTDGFRVTLESVAASREGTETAVGAGTVLDRETARDAIAAGAEFLVTPTFDEGVVRVGNRYGVPVLTGVATPTEALDAYAAGASMCKVFPARSLGPGFVSSLGGPLPQVPLVPTGGVSRENAAAFFEAGAAALGIGSSIAPDDAVSDGDFAEIERRAREFVAIADAHLDG
ncbi:bifunctional 4-hydroxy-2-oxoglutarate aldolase/2-dehydro-3-deoxy-phosphogluconate aldolase [Salinigranum marinum]|uniref:bifunctional 4-hydroxy-2-oxoglutarate aldolase/2-dehydro-3-deoxy-phosphogluconate aldolase n=1 Tax=Salinigranum marinum TaxID=1515595 RepID=UPI002989C70C|nr:bifunctional 4-hydroxy-2-oxoglutarate aldolase/2-dehydro-3-deoxy-phosphogluconate aldolase [Salinigranum marinum]